MQRQHWPRNSQWTAKGFTWIPKIVLLHYAGGLDPAENHSSRGDVLRCRSQARKEGFQLNKTSHREYKSYTIYMYTIYIHISRARDSARMRIIDFYDIVAAVKLDIPFSSSAMVSWCTARRLFISIRIRIPFNSYKSFSVPFYLSPRTSRVIAATSLNFYYSAEKMENNYIFLIRNNLMKNYILVSRLVSR